MNLGKLSKKLQKELTANPKKAAVLGLVCLVAVWFWSPLLMKWMGIKSAKAKAVTPVASASPPVALAAAEPPQASWLEVRSLRDADPLMQSVPLPIDARDPFVAPVIDVTPVAEESATEQAVATAPQPEQFDPEKLGLTLESIAYGEGKRRAQISGQTVKEKDQLTLAASGENEQATVVVKAIRRDEVELQVAGQTIRLKLQPKTLGRGNVVQRMSLP